MNDDGNVASPSSRQASAAPRRARTLGAIACALGLASLALLYFVPLSPAAFPWSRAGLSLAGIVTAVASLRSRPRDRLALALAVAGLIGALAFPALVAIIFALYFNWKG